MVKVLQYYDRRAGWCTRRRGGGFGDEDIYEANWEHHQEILDLDAYPEWQLSRVYMYTT